MRDGKPKISIIVPVYNVELYIEQCVDSLVSQSLKNIEIILVDDESPDRCSQICDDYVQKDSRIKVIHKKNGGLGYARNSGLEIATGEYVTFIDSDDYIDVDAYEKMIDAAERYELDIIRCTYNRFMNDGSHSAECRESDLVIYDINEIKQLGLSVFDKYKPKSYTKEIPEGSVCMAIFKRNIIENNHLRFVSERKYISEDYIFSYECYMHSRKVGYIANTYYHYRVNDFSLSQTIRKDRLQKTEEYCKFVTHVFQKYGMNEEDLLYCYGYYVNHSRSIMQSIFLADIPFQEKYLWFKDNINGNYFDKIFKYYPICRLSKKYRIVMLAMKYHSFPLCYFLVIAYSMVRSKKRKFGIS